MESLATKVAEDEAEWNAILAVPDILPRRVSARLAAAPQAARPVTPQEDCKPSLSRSTGQKRKRTSEASRIVDSSGLVDETELSSTGLMSTSQSGRLSSYLSSSSNPPSPPPSSPFSPLSSLPSSPFAEYTLHHTFQATHRPGHDVDEASPLSHVIGQVSGSAVPSSSGELADIAHQRSSTAKRRRSGAYIDNDPDFKRAGPLKITFHVPPPPPGSKPRRNPQAQSAASDIAVPTTAGGHVTRSEHDCETPVDANNLRTNSSCLVLSTSLKKLTSTKRASKTASSTTLKSAKTRAPTKRIPKTALAPKTPRSRKPTDRGTATVKAAYLALMTAKPEPQGQPLVWAEGRQALCETLPYFRSFQGGGHTSDGTALGFMFDRHCSKHDYIDSTVVIARSGGGMKLDEETGERVQAEDQVEKHQVRAVRDNIRQQNPVVLIVGNGNPKCPSKIPHRFAVLDWFKPTHVWSEKSEGKIIIRYRFEKLNSKEPSWWTPKDCVSEDTLGQFPLPNSEHSRRDFKGWTCETAGCDFTHTLPHALIAPNELYDAFNPLSKGYATSRDRVISSGIVVQSQFSHNYRINRYELPGIHGFVTHFIANRTVQQEAGGPDEMWTEMQTADTGLRRGSKPKGDEEYLGRQFMVNYGMPYKFITAATFRSFDDACNTIKAARSRLNWAQRYVNPGVCKDFNEVLAIGYFEEQSINYHDDGEDGLGPTIATLSLGYPAWMSIRLKHNHYLGVTTGENPVDEPPMPGCIEYQERRKAYDEMQTIEDKKERRSKLEALSAKLGLKSKPVGRQHAPDALKLHLGHGDIVIMHGEDIQKFYEHAVSPVGKLRFALTARHITPEHLTPEERMVYVVKEDENVYDGSAIV
ncbi:hypothetical protein B0A49_05860 [Cryomyces minteri]|uniref:Alpha-ketoglutarate-dependent dioxygenase AlkB-like domain-containing protein n=1 Tax=Cryomyces minteri TaxID=331657 RepID=A0A4U0X209_9PEZI|nr:hypothetical protein B0A49_05860 [Cryomyces minteri]